MIKSKLVLLQLKLNMGGLLYILTFSDILAQIKFLEFFAATIRNKNTRTAYLHATGRFFAWCDRHHLGQLADIEPLHVAAYIEVLQASFEKPTVKQHLAAIKMLFDWLVTGQVVPVNPAGSVRGPRHVVTCGQTPVLDPEIGRASCRERV